MLATALRSFASSASRRTATSTSVAAPCASALFSAQHALFSTEAPAVAATAVDAEVTAEKKRTKLKIPTKRCALVVDCSVPWAFEGGYGIIS